MNTALALTCFMIWTIGFSFFMWISRWFWPKEHSMTEYKLMCCGWPVLLFSAIVAIIVHYVIIRPLERLLNWIMGVKK